jgi:thioredoxin-dependent peroxiredoxin
MAGLQVGDRAPDFTLPSSTGEPVTLSEVLKQGPTVLAWYLFDFGRI